LFVPANVRAVVTRRGGVTRESESFAARVSGCERNREGCARTPTAFSRNREFSSPGRVVGYPCGKGEKRERPRGHPPGLSW
jgi:hypothetical protein